VPQLTELPPLTVDHLETIECWAIWDGTRDVIFTEFTAILAHFTPNNSLTSLSLKIGGVLKPPEISIQIEAIDISPLATMLVKPHFSKIKRLHVPLEIVIQDTERTGVEIPEGVDMEFERGMGKALTTLNGKCNINVKFNWRYDWHIAEISSLLMSI
jgi:hypothetical protein